MAEMAFTKMHGLGNDFVVIQDLAEEWDLTPPAIMLLCDRNFGIGADGSGRRCGRSAASAAAVGRLHRRSMTSVTNAR
jgi:diaminopimelate epimerase